MNLLYRRNMMYSQQDWLYQPTKAAIVGAFGVSDGTAVIKATSQYLNQLAASDRDKATALAGFINAYCPTYPEMIEQVCWLGFKHGIKGDGRALIDTNFVVGANDEIEIEYWGMSQSGDVQGEYVIGAGNSSFGDGFTIARNQGSGYFGGAMFMTNIPDFTKGIVKLEMSASKIVRYWNDVKVDEIDITPTGYTGQYLRFFGLKRQNSTLFDTTYLFTGIIYHIYIKRNGEYKFLLIPRTVNGNNGFVNMVNGSMVYRTNSNGAFSLVETTSLT